MITILFGANSDLSLPGYLRNFTLTLTILYSCFVRLLYELKLGTTLSGPGRGCDFRARACGTIRIVLELCFQLCNVFLNNFNIVNVFLF